MAGQASVRLAPPGVTDLLSVHEAFPDRYPHLLISDGAASTARFDILFAYPASPGILPAGASREDCARFLATLDDTVAPRTSPRASHPELPFLYGHFLFLSYELMGAFETRLVLSPPKDVPLAWVQRFDGALLCERATRRIYMTGRSNAVVDAIADDLTRINARPASLVAPIPFITEDAPEDYVARVRTVQHYIQAGDIFQANLSRGYEASVAPGTSAAAILRALRIHNPAPFSALARLGDTTIISASPERLLRTQGERIATYPIAGTVPRGWDTKTDAAACETLRHDPKERAEHVMLVDLERNDLGRVCAPGSIRVTQFMQIESYATVHHLVSEIQGILPPEVTPSRLIASLFPGGSITGCPKVRCMEILAQEEGGPRGAYTGSLGYINDVGDMDLNILIRTFVLQDQHLRWRVGAGIVADSDADRELTETRAKAAGLLRALGL